MGREIRRVPKGWQHPMDRSGVYRPLYDVDYDTAAKEWLENLMVWERDEEWKEAEDCRHYWDWDGPPPVDSYYRPKFEEDPTHYQIYETVSEGTPVSPVFETLNEMTEWLVEQGYSSAAAQNFAEAGWAPSMLVTIPGSQILNDIEACESFGAQV